MNVSMSEEAVTPLNQSLDGSFSSGTQSSQDVSMMFLSPLPRPELSAFEEKSFSAKSSTKKAKSKTRPPEAPFKSPPISRLGLNRRDLFSPQARVIKTPESLFNSHGLASSPSLEQLHMHHQSMFHPITTHQVRLKSVFEREFENYGRIGTGSFAEVFKVRCIRDGKFYAVKKASRPFRSVNDRDKALREVESFSKIMHHANCVHLYQAWEENDFLFLQMELCENGSLEDYLRSFLDGESLPEPQIWNFLIDIASAVQYMHHAGFVHLDIKPANLFLTAAGDLKLGDFGLSRQVDSLSSDTMEGDSAYLAPEALSGHFSFATDIFSLGASVFEMAAHIEMPKQGQLWHNLRQGNINLPCNRSRQLEQLVAWMMAPNPADRPSIDQVLQDLTVQQCLMCRDQIKQSTLRRVQALGLTIATRSPLLGVDRGLGTPDTFEMLTPRQADNDTLSPPPYNCATVSPQDPYYGHSSPVSYRREPAVKLSFVPIEPMFSRQLF